jgi:RNA polymerase sigma factor (TIGR02999 family)
MESGAERATQVTALIRRLNDGDRQALDALMPLVYDELRRIANRHLAQERPDHTLQPTALVHEAYLRLMDQRSSQWQGRLHFLSVAATMMRRVLIDHAKAKFRIKRGGAIQQRVSLEDIDLATEERALEVIAIDEALSRLAELDEIQAKVVELRFFGGVSLEETAQILSLSEATVKRYGNSARAWLQREIARGTD